MFRHILQLLAILLVTLSLVICSYFRSGTTRWNLHRARAQSSQCQGGTKLEHYKGDCMLHWECLSKKGVSIGPCFTSGSVGSCCMIDSAETSFPQANKPTRSPNVSFHFLKQCPSTTNSSFFSIFLLFLFLSRAFYRKKKSQKRLKKYSQAQIFQQQTHQL